MVCIKMIIPNMITIITILLGYWIGRGAPPIKLTTYRSAKIFLVIFGIIVLYLSNFGVPYIGQGSGVIRNYCTSTICTPAPPCESNEDITNSD